jgi:hypothetical protein
MEINMKLTDKQKEILLALVEGKEVEYFSQRHGSWYDIDDLQLIGVLPNEDLRIKPETPKDIIVKEYKKYLPCLDDAYDEPNVEYTFDGVTHVLKSVRMLGEESKEQPTDNGWISNIGNSNWCPPEGYGVDFDTRIEIKRRGCETTEIGLACHWDMSWEETSGSAMDIIKFRILED